jgi:hypothetical protein
MPASLAGTGQEEDTPYTRGCGVLTAVLARSKLSATEKMVRWLYQAPIGGRSALAEERARRRQPDWR